MCTCSKCGDITTLTVGPKGDPGATGATGPAGAAGATGATGPAGLATMSVLDAKTATVTLNGTTDSGTLVILDRAIGIVVTLPSVPANGTNYTFQVGTSASGGSYVINVNGAGLDTLAGFIYMNKAATAPALFAAVVGASTQMTMNETTTGGLVGGNITMVYNSNKWYVSGSLFGSGAVATPFS